MLSGILLAEALALSIAFDGNDLRSLPWLFSLLRIFLKCVRPAPIILIVTVALSWERIRTLMRSRPELQSTPHWFYLFAHLTMIAVFTRLGTALTAGQAPSLETNLLGIAWIGSGVLSLIFWLGTILTWGSWAALARVLIRPLLVGCLTGALVSVASQSTPMLWLRFRGSTFWSVNALLSLVSQQTICDPDKFVLGLSGFRVQIAPACSGYEGIGLILAFLGLYLVVFRQELRFPAALLLLPIGTLAIWAANVVRITALVAIGAAGHPGLALNGFHSQSGWIAFIAVGLGLIWASRASGLFHRRTAGAAAPGATNPVAPLVMPLLVLMATTMITAAVTSGEFDRLYPVRVIAVASALWFFRDRYEFARFSVSVPAVGIGILVFVLWMALEPGSAGGEGRGAIPEGLRQLSTTGAALWLVARVVGSVVTVPIAEELAFRGFLLRRLVSHRFESVSPHQFTLLSVVGSSAGFGALHGRWLAGFLAGVAYAMAYRLRGRLGDAVVAHAVTNALIAGLVLATGRWSLWT